MGDTLSDFTVQKGFLKNIIKTLHTKKMLISSTTLEFKLF